MRTGCMLPTFLILVQTQNVRAEDRSTEAPSATTPAARIEIEELVTYVRDSHSPALVVNNGEQPFRLGVFHGSQGKWDVLYRSSPDESIAGCVTEETFAQLVAIAEALPDGEASSSSTVLSVRHKDRRILRIVPPGQDGPLRRWIKTFCAGESATENAAKMKGERLSDKDILAAARAKIDPKIADPEKWRMSPYVDADWGRVIQVEFRRHVHSRPSVVIMIVHPVTGEAKGRPVR